MKSKNKKSRRRVNRGNRKKYNVRSRKLYKKMKGGSNDEEVVPGFGCDEIEINKNYSCTISGNQKTIAGTVLKATNKPEICSSCVEN